MANLTRVELRWDDGRTRLLEGEAAQRWSELMNGALQMSANHGLDYGPELSAMSWKERTRLETAERRKLVDLLTEELCALWDDLARRIETNPRSPGFGEPIAPPDHPMPGAPRA